MPLQFFFPPLEEIVTPVSSSVNPWPPPSFPLSLKDVIGSEFEGVSTVSFLKSSQAAADGIVTGLFDLAGDPDNIKLASIQDAIRTALQKSILRCPVVAARLTRSSRKLLDCLSCLSMGISTKKYANTLYATFPASKHGVKLVVRQMDPAMEQKLIEGSVNNKSALNGLWGKITDPSDSNVEQVAKLVDGIAKGGQLIDDDSRYLSSVCVSIGTKSGIVSVGLSICHTICDGYTHYFFLKALLNFIGEELARIDLAIESNTAEANTNLPSEVQIPPVPHLGNQIFENWLPSNQPVRSSLWPYQYFLGSMRLRLLICRLMTLQKVAGHRNFIMYLPSDKQAQIKKLIPDNPLSTNDAMIQFFAPRDAEIITFPLNARGRIKSMPLNSTGNGELFSTATVPRAELYAGLSSPDVVENASVTYTHLNHRHVREAVNVNKQPNFRCRPILCRDKQFGWNSWASVSNLPQFISMGTHGHLELVGHCRATGAEERKLAGGFTSLYWNTAFAIAAAGAPGVTVGPWSEPGQKNVATTTPASLLESACRGEKAAITVSIFAKDPEHAVKIARRCCEIDLEWRVYNEKYEEITDSEKVETALTQDVSVTKMNAILDNLLYDDDESKASHRSVTAPHWCGLCFCIPLCGIYSCLCRLSSHVLCLCWACFPQKAGTEVQIPSKWDMEEQRSLKSGKEVQEGCKNV